MRTVGGDELRRRRIGSDPDTDGAVASFAADVILPRVRAMDDNSYMEPEVIQGLFDNGVSCAGCPLVRTET